jgi:lysophospholipase L1-like esterase
LRHLALGDSYTIGEGVAEHARWPVALARALARLGVALEPPEIVARTGWTTDELESAIAAADPRGPYELVTLLVGVNDQYRGRDAEAHRPAFVRLLRAAIGFAGGEATRAIVVSIPDWGVTPFAAGRDRAAIAAAIDRFNAVQRQETVALGARWVDVTRVSREAPAQVVDDGLHPSPGLYARWVERILPDAMAALQT